MITSRLDADGRVALPRNVIDAFELQDGDAVEFVQLGPHRFELLVRNRSVAELRGLFVASRGVSIDEINEAIKAQGASANIANHRTQFGDRQQEPAAIRPPPEHED